MSGPVIDQEPPPTSPLPPAKRSVFRVVFWTLGVPFILILIHFLFAIQVHLAVVFHLLTGWLRFILKVLPLVQLNTGLILSSLLSLGVAVWLLHRAVTAICSKKGGRVRWTIKQTLATTTLILMLFGAVLAGTGMGYQIVWMKQEWGLTVAGLREIHEKSTGSFTHDVWVVLKQWADAHSGHYPSSLHELVPDYIDDPKAFSLVYLWSPVRSGPHEPWIYLGASLTASDPGHLPLLVSPRPFYSGQYVVCRINGSVSSETPENYRTAIADWRAYSAKSERTPK